MRFRSNRMPMPLLIDRIAMLVAYGYHRPVPWNCTIHYTAISLVHSEMRTHRHRITCAAPAALRQSDHENCLTRVLCPTHMKKVGPTGSYILAKPTHNCGFSVPSSDRKSWWMGRDHILFCVRSHAAPLRLFLRSNPALRAGMTLSHCSSQAVVPRSATKR